jgi:hypothetical protein
MKDWLLILAEEGTKLSELAGVRIQAFRSGDGDRPEPGDLKQAVDELVSREYRARPMVDVVELLLVSLDAATTVEASRQERFAIRSIVDYEAPLKL